MTYARRKLKEGKVYHSNSDVFKLLPGFAVTRQGLNNEMGSDTDSNAVPYGHQQVMVNRKLEFNPQCCG